MDSLVRMCLEQDNNPAVMILEPSTEGGTSPQAAHLKVAQAYNIPMISYHDAVMPEIEPSRPSVRLTALTRKQRHLTQALLHRRAMYSLTLLSEAVRQRTL